MAGEGGGYGVTGDDARRSENKAAMGFDTHARKGGCRVGTGKGADAEGIWFDCTYGQKRVSPSDQQSTLARRKTSDVGTWFSRFFLCT